MNRRRLLASLTAFVAAAVATFGTGAFDAVGGRRDVTIGVAEDSAATLALSSGSGDPGGFVTEGGDGAVGIDVGTVDNGTVSPGDGVNDGSVTAIDDVLRIDNRGSDRVRVTASFPPSGGVVLFSSYGGPGSVLALDEPAGGVTIDPGAFDEVGVALDAGYGTGEIPGTYVDGDVVNVTIQATAV